MAPRLINPVPYDHEWRFPAGPRSHRRRRGGAVGSAYPESGRTQFAGGSVATTGSVPAVHEGSGREYSLSVISADAYDEARDEVLLLDGTRQSPDALAAKLISPGGYLVQGRLRQAPALAELFGPQLWSVRLLVFHGVAGPVIHRAVAKVATGTNPADNYWRPGNMLGAIALESGTIWRVVSGTGAGLSINPNHSETRRAFLGIEIPGWVEIKELVLAAAPIFAGIRTQSWDVALTEAGPVILEVNFGGDLNLAQLATGKGVLDDEYCEHLKGCGMQV
jgi:hypothetical protein